MSALAATTVPGLSVVIPVLNDAQQLHALLDNLARVLPNAEIIVVDGGSSDLVREDVAAHVRWACTDASRGRQLRIGTEMARSEWLWLLHADSVISRELAREFVGFLNTPNGDWGRFDVAIEGLPVVSWFANKRSALTGICTGDQGIFVRRDVLRSIGGVPDQPLMEDIELSTRLKRRRTPVRLRGPIVTSPRRWEKRGVVLCILQMWRFRMRYWAGASPADLASDYYDLAPRTPPAGAKS